MLGVDDSYRYTERARELRRRIQAGELGKVFSLELVFHNAYGPDKPWCFDPELAGGGALMDLGVHLIDLAFWLLDDPAIRRVQGGVFRQGERLSLGRLDSQGRSGVDDFASAWLGLGEGDVAASLAVSWNAYAGKDCVIRAAAFGTEGGAEFRNVGGSFYDFELERFSGRSGDAGMPEPPLVDQRLPQGIGRRLDPFAMEGCKSGHMEVEDALVFTSRQVGDTQVLRTTDAQLEGEPFSGGSERPLAIFGVLRN